MRLLSRRNLTIAAVVVGIPVLALAWWLGSPLFIDKEVNEAFPLSAAAVVPDDMTREQVETTMQEAANQPDETTEDSMPAAEPVKLLSGTFNGADNFHEGQGRAVVYQLDDGSRVLRLEAFEVTNGPDLHVYLVPDDDPLSSGDVSGYVDLGALKGNVGDQNYEIPDDVDVEAFGSVVIYCEPFHVIFATSRLS